MLLAAGADAAQPDGLSQRFQAVHWAAQVTPSPSLVILSP
jgi:hypothetical protein